MAKYIFVPLGSAGDVNPLAWLARLMSDRGHDTVMVVQDFMADSVERAGLRVLRAGRAEDQEQVVRNPNMWDPIKAFPLLARQSPVWASEMIPHIRGELVQGQTVLVGAGIALAARIVSELDSVPLVTAHLQPCILMSPHDCPVLVRGMETLKRRPLWVRKLLFRLGYLNTDFHLRRRVNRLRAAHGLRRPVRRILDRYALSPDLVMALFPEWFGPRQPDWAPNIVTTRFPLYDRPSGTGLSPELEQFLSSGDPPVCITPGSANMHGAQFLGEAVRGTTQAGRRAIVVTPFKEQLPLLPTDCVHVSSAPFTQLFPRCALVIHHGGVGTCAQAMAAGVPQLIRPMAHDQPDNAWRIQRMGIGEALFPRQFDSHSVCRHVETLLSSPAVRENCMRIKHLSQSQMPPDQVAGILERLAPGGNAHVPRG